MSFNFRKFIISLAFVFFSIELFSQENITVDLEDEVYVFLELAESKGYCSRLSYVKPYTKKYIVSKLQDIKEYIEASDSIKFKENELKTVDFYISRYTTQNGFDYTKMSYRREESIKGTPMSFEVNNTVESFVSSGVYNNSELNSTGFEIFENLNFIGDIGRQLSYRSTFYLGAVDMPLQQVGDDYLIGYWWYDGWKENPDKNIARTINSYRNNSVLPYSYKKKWDGSVYYFSNLSSNGLEGWPIEPAVGLGMLGELRTNLLDDKVSIGFSRLNREWGGMSSGSSLVYNYNASPFVAFDAGVNFFDWFSFQTLTGVLEFPNAAYINENAWYRITRDEDGNPEKDTSITDVVDSYFFQNVYSITMFNLDFKYIHFDFGSTCVWPKRFELGYMFPLIDKVIYQNNVGDYDNLALFANLKGYIPDIASLWGSFYLEEMNSLKPQLFEKTRCMFAYQGGAKTGIPFLPFTMITARYTKVEPYCYTHQAIRKQPWYDEYINEPYANNGHSIGYYLEPNSDELLIRIDSKPFTALSAGLQYQMIRHGADFGYAQVPGSSIWSELPIGNRNIYYKYFLHDGAYEWTHVIKLDGSYSFKAARIPFQISASIGFIYDFYTLSEEFGSSENNYFVNKSTPYHRVDDSVYQTKTGFVFSIGIKMFAFDICQ